MIFTTLCGRMNKQSEDGMNIAETDEAVTCKFCLRIMADTGRTAMLLKAKPK